jgi:hypothetical protein
MMKGTSQQADDASYKEDLDKAMQYLEKLVKIQE